MRLPSGDQLGVLSAAGSLVSRTTRSEEHTSELQSRSDLVCRLLLEKKKKQTDDHPPSDHTLTVKDLRLEADRLRVQYRLLSRVEAQASARLSRTRHQTIHASLAAAR